MKRKYDWYFWFPVLPRVIGPFDTRKDARNALMRYASPYQKKHAVYIKELRKA